MEELFRHLIEFTNDGVFRFTLDEGLILFANKGFMSIFELDMSPQEVIGRRIDEVQVYLMPPRTIRGAIEKHREIHQFEYHFRTLKGNDRWLLHDSFLTVDERSGLPCVDAIVKDITSRKIAEQQLEQRVQLRTAALMDANAEFENVMYSISHDLRAPLRAINGFSAALLEDWSDRFDEPARANVKRIAAAAVKMHELIEDLLAYSKLGRKDLHLGPVDLDVLFKEVLDPSGTYITTRLADIDVASPLGLVVAHKGTLFLVAQNLLANAIKFTKPGHRASVRIFSERRPQGRVRVWVQDEGIGIREKYFAQIFRPFERLHTSLEYPGTGIGLAIVRRGVDRMGGAAGVESEVDRGSRVWIEFEEAPEG